MDDLRSDIEVLEDKVSMAEGECKIMKEKYALERVDWDKKVCISEYAIET